jgi:hypothetical protein
MEVRRKLSHDRLMHVLRIDEAVQEEAGYISRKFHMVLAIENGRRFQYGLLHGGWRSCANMCRGYIQLP